MSNEKPFRIFNLGCIEIGGYEDNFLEGNPEERSGAMVFFDAWKQSSYFQFRIYHPVKDLPIKLTGTGFAQIDHASTYIPNTDRKTGKELDYGEWLTTIPFYLTAPEGQAQVDMAKTHPWDEDTLIKWDSTHIVDIHGCKAKLKVVSHRQYEISEILSEKQKAKFALIDRYYKLKQICTKNRLFDAHHQLSLSYIHGDFNLTDED
tara:strand:+ start:131 stop:745 length:615 start_codon:yes stop_codon:yes gene_type:complete